MPNKKNLNSIFSGLWGFAEATLFFILPDVLLSYIALDKKEPILKYCLMALIGALLGGALFYWLGAYYQTTMLQLIEAVPAINSDLISIVFAWLQQDGALAILLGPIQGLPYKVFAVQAYQSGIGFWEFILITIPARFIRFMLIAYLSRFLSLITFRQVSKRNKVITWASVWVLIYTAYFLMFPS